MFHCSLWNDWNFPFFIGPSNLIIILYSLNACLNISNIVSPIYKKLKYCTTFQSCWNVPIFFLGSGNIRKWTMFKCFEIFYHLQKITLSQCFLMDRSNVPNYFLSLDFNVTLFHYVFLRLFKCSFRDCLNVLLFPRRLFHCFTFRIVLMFHCSLFRLLKCSRLFSNVPLPGHRMYKYFELYLSASRKG